MPVKLTGKDPNNVQLTDKEFDKIPMATKFEIDITCNGCKSRSCFFFKKDIPFNSYSFSIGCHDCGASEDY